MTARRMGWVCAMSWMLSACTTPFLPQLDNFEELLVVDGSITDAPGPYVVSLAIAGGVYDKDYHPLAGAAVFIREQGGQAHVLKARETGKYYSDSQAFRARKGKSYRLELTLASGKQYASQYEIIPDNPGIDTVNSEVAYRYYDELQAEIPGYQFYVSSRPADEDPAYYLWMMEGTYKHEASYSADFIYRGFLAALPDPFKYKTCYRTYPIEAFMTGATTSLEGAAIVRKPLFFLRGDDIKLLHRYCLLVRQLSVSREAYTYWEGARNQSASSTSLYNVQPYLLKGNVTNIADEDETVLGYFLVAGEAQHRVYVNRPTAFPVDDDLCALDYEGYPFIFGSEPAEWPIYVTIGPSGRAVSGAGCINCEQRGGSIVPPDWWVE